MKKAVAVEADGFDAVPELLAASTLPRLLVDGVEKVVIKPNLIGNYPPPVTTPAEAVFRAVSFIRDVVPSIRVVIAEGCGEPGVTTGDLFRKLGYAKEAARAGVDLVDLNDAPVKRSVRRDCGFLCELELPEVVLDGLLVSFPVLKAHSMARVTLSLKNMVGLLPPRRYSVGGHWNKAAIHRDLHRGIVELNLHRKPDFAILDATKGMAEAHLWGAECDPPVRILACGEDPVALDAFGALLLGEEPSLVEHIRMADGRLGSIRGAEDFLKVTGRA